MADKQRHNEDRFQFSLTHAFSALAIAAIFFAVLRWSIAEMSSLHALLYSCAFGPSVIAMGILLLRYGFAWRQAQRFRKRDRQFAEELKTVRRQMEAEKLVKRAPPDAKPPGGEGKETTS